MTFPGTPLGATVEIDTGSWTDITSYALQQGGTARRGRTGVRVSRGRGDGAQQGKASRAAMRWNNADGRFSPRNPAGPWFGTLGKNTPVRVSIPAQSTYLRLETDAVSAFTAPDALGAVAATDVRLDVEVSSWMPCVLAGKWTASQRSWALLLNGDGTLAWWWSPDGTTIAQLSSTAPVPLGRLVVRAALDTTTSSVTFYTATAGGADAGPWTQLGDTVTLGGSTSVYASSADLAVGAAAQAAADDVTYAAGMTGSVWEAEMRTGTTVTAHPVFSAQTAGAASFTDAQSVTWTASGTAELSARNYRGHFECSSLPQQRDVTGHDVWTPVSAAGPLRRLGQASPPPVSSLKRAWLDETATAYAPAAYWPCEDGTSATQIASPLAGVQPMTVTGTPTFASDTSLDASAALPVVANSTWRGSVPRYAATLYAAFRFVMDIATAPANGTVLMSAGLSSTSWAGGGGTVELLYGTGDTLRLVVTDATGASVYDSGYQAAGTLTGAPVMVSVELDGSAVTSNFTVYAMTTAGVVSSPVASGTYTLGYLTAQQVTISPNGDVDQVGVGHIAVQSAIDDLATVFAAPLAAHTGETAASRFARLCGENGLGCRVIGAPDVSVAMGPQTVQPLLTLLQECEDADRGMIFEPRQALAVAYRTSASLTTQTAAASLTYSQLSPALTPLDDDQLTRNDVTISRQGGSSATSVLDDGSAMSVSDPPTGVGDYQWSATVNVRSDGQLADEAGWVRHLGTVDEPRWPSVTVDLADTALAGVFYDVLGVDCGDRIAVSSLPVSLAPDGIDAIVWGLAEDIGDKALTVTWQTRPGSPWQTLVAGSGATTDPRADTDGSTLHAAITATDTTMEVDTASGHNYPLWTTAAADFPFDLQVGGERVTVLAVQGPPGNFFTGQMASFDGAVGTWGPSVNCTAAESTAQAHSGSGSLAVAAVAAGNMVAASCASSAVLTEGMACSPGDQVSSSVWALAASVARNCAAGVEFFTSAGAHISSLYGSFSGDSTSAWTQFTSALTAPATSAWCRVVVEVQATAAAGETHYLDEPWLANLTTGSAQTQTMIITRSVNGVAKAQTAGTAVNVADPVYLALV